MQILAYILGAFAGDSNLVDNYGARVGGYDAMIRHDGFDFADDLVFNGQIFKDCFNDQITISELIVV